MVQPAQKSENWLLSLVLPAKLHTHSSLVKSTAVQSLCIFLCAFFEVVIVLGHVGDRGLLGPTNQARMPTLSLHFGPLSQPWIEGVQKRGDKWSVFLSNHTDR